MRLLFSSFIDKGLLVAHAVLNENHVTCLAASREIGVTVADGFPALLRWCVRRSGYTNSGSERLLDSESDGHSSLRANRVGGDDDSE